MWSVIYNLMIFRHLSYFRRLNYLILLVAGILVSCSRIPKPGFDYSPTGDIEAGDTLFFTNTTRNGGTFLWEFGDGFTSDEVHPVHVYGEAGIYEVRLTAMNDEGEDSYQEDITIFEPTILGFLTYDSEDSTILIATKIWIYDNEADWSEGTNPLDTGLTNREGIAWFFHMEPITYYIHALNVGMEGYWVFSGNTPDEIVPHEINLYSVPCIWMEGSPESKRSDLFNHIEDRSVHPFDRRHNPIPGIR